MEAYDPFGDDGAEAERSRSREHVASPSRKRPRTLFSDAADGTAADAAPQPEPSSSSQVHIRNNKDPAELIGNVRPLSNPRKQRLCSHFLKNDCLWGEQCRFVHNPDELRGGAPATKTMNFSNLEACSVIRSFSVPKSQLRFFMTESSRQLLTNASGVSEVSWDPSVSKVTISGTAAQVGSAEQLVKRVITHCRWGVSEAKIQGLLSQRPCTAVRLRLSPMVPALKQVVFNLTAARPQVSIGSGSSNDLVLKGPLISRSHAVLEFLPHKGALYVVDASTNGTFLNGLRLPTKSSGKVALFHGDELLFPEAKKRVDDLEFGYMVNLELA